MASNQNLDSFNRIKEWVTNSIKELQQFEQQTPSVPAKEKVNKAIGKFKIALEQTKNAFQLHETKTQRMQQNGQGQYEQQMQNARKQSAEYSTS